MNDFWTDERVSTIKQMVGERKSAGEIAKHLGVTRNTVCGKMHRLGLKMPDKAAVGVEEKPAPKPAYNENHHHHPRYNAMRNVKSTFKYEDEGSHRKRCSKALSLQPQSPGISMGDLKSGECHFPYGENTPYNYCGRGIKEGSAYCADHHLLTHVKSYRRKPIDVPQE